MDYGLCQPGNEMWTYDYVLIISTTCENFILCFVNMINISKAYINLRLRPEEPI